MNVQPQDRTITRLFWAVTLALVAIAAGAFALSYSALLDLASENGAAPGLAFIWPLIVDTSMLVYTASVLVAHLQRRPARLPVALTILYSLVTVTGNILHAPPTALGWFVAALPPVSLVLGAEMLRVMGQHIIERAGAMATLAELEAQRETATAEFARQQAEQAAELEAARQSAADEMGTLTRQTETARARLEVLRAEIKGEQAGRIGASVQEMNAAKQARIEERRQRVLELLPQFSTRAELAAELGISEKTLRADIKALNGQVRA